MHHEKREEQKSFIKEDVPDFFFYFLITADITRGITLEGGALQFLSVTKTGKRVKLMMPIQYLLMRWSNSISLVLSDLGSI